MSTPYFQFQQFTVRHDRCAMKVGTDGVLLGAWADMVQANRVLDIGTGTGLIALMLAQRNPLVRITGIDVDEAAVSQAVENFRESPFAERLTATRADVRTFEGQFDALVCNPPFYTEDILPPNKERSLARNSVNLSFAELFRHAARLLTDGGTFSLIFPTARYTDLMGWAVEQGFGVRRLCRVRTKSNKAPKRMMLDLVKGKSTNRKQEELILQDETGARSEAYRTLTKAFYL